MKTLAIFLLILFCSSAISQERYTGPIIDMHLHAYANDSEMFRMEHPLTLRKETFKPTMTIKELEEETLKRMEKYNVVMGVVTNGNVWKSKVKERVLVAKGVIPTDTLRKSIESGDVKVIAELAPFYANLKADDPSMDATFALAEELGIPVGVHILPGGPNDGIHLLPQVLGNMRAKNASPLQLEPILIKYPNIKLYIMHGGWPYVDDVKALLYMHSNLYVDLAVLNWVLPKQECYNYIKSLIDAGFGDRIMYGTDQMSWPDVIDTGIETIQSADFLSVKQKEDIFYNNAARFLGLSEETIKKHKSK